MKCYFLRHGIAIEGDVWAGSDFDRPLTDEGRARMKRAAKTIAAWDLAVDAIVTSPLLRAKQTAAIVAQAMRLQDRLVEDERLGGGFGPAALAGVLADYSNAKALMLVGHEPGLSQTIAQLAGGAAIEMKKGSLACVDLPDPASPTGTLVWLVPPKLLARKKERA